MCARQVERLAGEITSYYEASTVALKMKFCKVDTFSQHCLNTEIGTTLTLQDENFQSELGIDPKIACIPGIYW